MALSEVCRYVKGFLREGRDGIRWVLWVGLSRGVLGGRGGFPCVCGYGCRICFVEGEMGF